MGIPKVPSPHICPFPDTLPMNSVFLESFDSALSSNQ